MEEESSARGGKATVLFRWLIEFEVAGSFDERATQDWLRMQLPPYKLDRTMTYFHQLCRQSYCLKSTTLSFHLV